MSSSCKRVKEEKTESSPLLAVHSRGPKSNNNNKESVHEYMRLFLPSLENFLSLSLSLELTKISVTSFFPPALLPSFTNLSTTCSNLTPTLSPSFTDLTTPSSFASVNSLSSLLTLFILSARLSPLSNGSTGFQMDRAGLDAGGEVES